MIIAAAQIRPHYEDIIRNTEEHKHFVKLAAAHGVQLIAFPEMSLTGYVRESAQKLSFTSNDSRLDSLRKLASEYGMVIIAGAPVKLVSGLHIGAFIIFPDESVSVYTKQFLHTGEEAFFEPSFAHNQIIHLGNERISVAICADIANPLHAENAGKVNSTLYIASIFYTPGAILEAHTVLSRYAKKYSMSVLMSNYCGESWNVAAAGKSGLWSEYGETVSVFESNASGLLIGQKSKDGWQGRLVMR